LTGKRFDPSQAHRLDAPERLQWLPPAEVLKALRLQPGESIADIGAGTGYFSLPMAKEIGARGIVYAVDSQEEMLALLKKKVAHHCAGNLHLAQAEAGSTGLADGCCDLVFMANVWHEFPDRAVVLRECLRILKRPGRVAVLDWRPDVERMAGPPLDHRIRAADAAAELRATGLKDITERNIGKYSWLVQGRIAPAPQEGPRP
jgi:ubiquinone/menaquinone biosynthesis C-methylase UbiE